MSETIVKTTFREFKKFLETAPNWGRVGDRWTVESDNSDFDNHMGGRAYDTDELIHRIKEYKSMQQGWYGDVGADFVYVLNPNDDFAFRWDQAIEQLLPRQLGEADESNTWREDLERLILERPSSQLDEFIYNDGSASDFLNFACDVVDITECQWSTLFAERT